MAFSLEVAAFQQEIDAVDPTKKLVFVLNTATYGFFEFSYSGAVVGAEYHYTIVGGADVACEYGASHLLEAMGYRFFAPADWAKVRPPTLATGLTLAKTSYWMQNNRAFLEYGHSWPGIDGGPAPPEATTVYTNTNKWTTLNGLWTIAYPVGVRWPTVISSNRGFFQSHPQMVKGDPATATAFDLTVTGADYDLLVEFCAGYLLLTGLNEWHRTHFDPTDGDTHTSDQVFPFSKKVGEKMRLGTSAINWPAGATWTAGTLAAQAGVPDCEIGVYAYANHDPAPTLSVKPNVYVQIAMSYTSFAIIDLVIAHGDKAQAVLLREYWEVQASSHGYPMANIHTKDGYFDSYDELQAAGALAINTQYNANWLMLLAMWRYGIRKLRTGAGTYAEAVDELVAYLFDDDEAVRDLYMLWGSNSNRLTRHNLRVSCDLIAAMADSWYKTYFEQYMVVCKKRYYLPPQIPLALQTPSDPFPAAFSDYMSNVVGIRFSDIFHSYAQCRQEARGAVLVNYRYLMFESAQSGLPSPDYYRNPVIPSHADFVAAHGVLTSETYHDPDLDDPDLVLVRGITPATVIAGPYIEAPGFFALQSVPFAFVGPGRVILREAVNGVPFEGGMEEILTYGPGLHFFEQPVANWFVTNEGGELFMDTLSGVARGAHPGTAPLWLYMPTRSVGLVVMEARTRWRLYDTAGVFDVLPKTHAGYQNPATRLTHPGQIYVDNASSGDWFSNLGFNRWMSKKPTVALLPRPIAEEDFADRAIVKVAA